MPPLNPATATRADFNNKYVHQRAPDSGLTLRPPAMEAPLRLHDRPLQSLG